MNRKALETASLLGLPWTGGSDAHAPAEVGSCYTEFATPVTLENFVDQIKAGRFRGVDTRKISRLAVP
jgi:predicted metal-dependent phosphoesterase TrpH